MSNVVLTGATEFVGSTVLSKLIELEYSPRIVRRSRANDTYTKVNQIVVESIDSKVDWKDLLVGCDIVIHCAARVHVMNEKAENPLTEFREVNLNGTINLAKSAIKSGVKRFIFISPIKVGGEISETGCPLNEKSSNVPIDPYGLSKYEAEEELKKLSKKHGMEVVIIRPSLVYGPGVKANFETMMKWLSKGIPSVFYHHAQFPQGF